MHRNRFVWVALVAGVFALTVVSSARATLIAWYNFSDSSNPAVVADNSGNGHTGSVLGSATYATPLSGAPAFITGAMNFGATNNDAVSLDINGTSNPFSEATSAGTNAITVSFWIYGNANQPQQQFTFFANGTGGRAISSHTPWSDGTIYFDTAGCCSDPGQRLTYGASQSQYSGQWNQYTLVKDSSGNKSIYIDGTPVASNPGNANIDSITDFIIGNYDGGGYAYGGQIADFAIFDNALNQSQVTQLVKDGAVSFTPEPASLGLISLSAFGLLARRRA